MGSLQALIFDVDGTLAETEEVHRQTFNEAFAASGLEWHWDQALYGELLEVTGGKERIAHYQEISGITVLNAAGIAALHADKTARYAAAVQGGGMVLRSGVRRLLREAKAAGVRLAVATTTSRSNVTALLAAAGTLPTFDVIAAGDEVAAKKPAPDVYALALRLLELPAGACLAFEDSLNGVNSALAATLRCVVTVSAYGGRGPFDGASAVLSGLGDADAPAEVLDGPELPGGVVDLAWLERLGDAPA